MKNTIIGLFPEHKTFVEGFGGAGHIIFAKEPSQVDVYNDINEGLYLFFKLLRDEETKNKLISQIQLTPYSREEFYSCRDTYQEDDIDDIEKARRFYIKTMQSFSSIGKSWSYSKNKSRRGISQAVSKYLGNVDDNMIALINRLREIQVENLDIIELIIKYDSSDTLFYLDPPYIAETRTVSNVYDKEMPLEKHEELVDYLCKVKGKVVLSGYDNLVYDKLISNGWIKENIGTYANRNGDKDNKKTKLKDEFIWLNFDIKLQSYLEGKILKDGEKYSAEYKIKINNKDIKQRVIEVLSTFDWKSYLNCIAMRKIQQFHVVDILSKEIPEIKQKYHFIQTNNK